MEFLRKRSELVARIILLAGISALFLTGCDIDDLQTALEEGYLEAQQAGLFSGLSASWAVSTNDGASASTGTSIFLDAACDQSDNIYTAGYITGDDTVYFGNGVSTSGGYASGKNLILCKYSPTSYPQWVRSTGSGSGESSFNAVAVGPDAVYAAGYVSGTGSYSLGNGVTAWGRRSSGRTLLLVKYSLAGSAQWARTLSAASSDNSQYDALCVDDAGNIYAAGSIISTYNYTLESGKTVQGPSTGSNIILTKYSPDGSVVWVRSAGSGGGSNWVEGLAYSSSTQQVIVCGTISGSADYGFGNGVAVAGVSATYNPLLAAFDSVGSAQWAVSTTSGSSRAQFSGVAVASDGSVYATGYRWQTSDLGFGNGVAVNGAAFESILLVKYNSSGSALWGVVPASGTVDSSGKSLAIEDHGYPVVSGRFLGGGTMGFAEGPTFSGVNSGDNWLTVAFTPAGKFAWGTTPLSGTNQSAAYGTAALSASGVAVVGSIRGNNSFSFGPDVNCSGNASSTENLTLVLYE